VDRIVCSKDTVDLFNPKVVQATMGSIFRIPVEYADLATFIEAKQLPVYGALLEGKPLKEFNFEASGILLVGNEGKGISSALLPYIDHPVHIPGKGGAESLNVAVATGILLAAFSA
jgi:TrmH family RNA methyltransferase